MTTTSVVRAIGAVAIAAAAVSCSHRSSSQPVRIRIAGGSRNATFSTVANALASLYSQRLPDVSAVALVTTGTTPNLDAVETGGAECGFGSADLVYDAYVHGTTAVPRPHTLLRGVAVLFPNTVHLVTRADSGLMTLADLAGKRVAAAVPGDAAVGGRGFRLEPIASLIADMAPGHQRPKTVIVQMDGAVGQLERGEIDAAHFYGGYPYRPVTDAADRYAIHFVELDDMAASLMKDKYPFSKSVVIPASTYPGQQNAVRTVAVDNILVCRADLPADLVYRLTLTLYEGVATIASAHASAQQINPEHGAATPIPLHEGATRYYRERELFR